MSDEVYDTQAWIIDALTDYTAIECMPKETVAMLESGQPLDMSDILLKIKKELSENKSKREHYVKYGGKYDALHPKRL